MLALAAAPLLLRSCAEAPTVETAAIRLLQQQARPSYLGVPATFDQCPISRFPPRLPPPTPAGPVRLASYVADAPEAPRVAADPKPTGDTTADPREDSHASPSAKDAKTQIAIREGEPPSSQSPRDSSVFRGLTRLLNPAPAAQPPNANVPVKIPLSGSLPPGSVKVETKGGVPLVSMVVRDGPLNDMLALLAENQGLNVITAEDITARISVTLRDVPFEQALTNILSVAGYTWVRQGNILIITSITADRTAAPSAQGREVHVFSLDYVAAADVDLVIKGLLSPAGQSFAMTTADTDNRRTQELVVVEDLPAYLGRIEQYIQQVDLPPRQVLIEAHILSIELQDDAKHGVNLAYLDELGTPKFTLKTVGLADPAASPALLFNVTAGSLNTLLETLETTTDAKTLARPKVLALNGQQARIQIGEQLGFRVTTTTQTSTMESVDFLDVGVVLVVTPWITKDNNVLLKVKPEVSSGEINQKTELPEEETTEVETSLMLPNGHGMVIGGLIKESDVETQKKIPVVGDLWLIGRLFQQREIKRKRSEIIIALIPHIVPYCPQRQYRECAEFQRSTTPLLYGPLLPALRPYEPRFPDAGQRMTPRYKIQHLRALPDPGCWRPRVSEEACAPGGPPAPPMYGGEMPFQEGITVLESTPNLHDPAAHGEIIPTPMPQSRR